MATTDQRAGFRLPWSSDQRSQDRIGDDAPEAGADEGTAELASETPAAEQAPEAVAHETKKSNESAETAATEHPVLEAAPVSADVSAPTSSGVGKRPTKFLADLTKAMQAAAESSREQTLGQLQGDAKAFIEEIHGRSSTEASELRRRADDDVAAIRDWSKAEIARVREDTERKIAGRKSVLETQIEHHAAVIEREIDRIQGQIGRFEEEMAEFFARLLAEDDPTKFAAMAENLPEPPPFEARSLTVEELIEEAAAAAAAVAVADLPVIGETKVEATASAASVAVEEKPAEAEGKAQAGWAEVPMDTAATDGATDASPEVAMAAIQAAFEAAAQAEADEARAEVAAERPEAVAGTVAGETDADAEQAEADTATREVAAEAGTAEAGTAEASDENADVAGDAEPGADDPRLAALGLSGFDAAEAEAAALTNGDVDDEIAVIDDDALAARLNGLVPAHDAEQPKKASSSKETVNSQVVVVGLVSVASIASFKRHLGRISGVQSVGVSSGPDGEFVFAVSHTEDVALNDVVATLPGFQARVTNAGDGFVNVTAHDPESEG